MAEESKSRRSSASSRKTAASKPRSAGAKKPAARKTTAKKPAAAKSSSAKKPAAAKTRAKSTTAKSTRSKSAAAAKHPTAMAPAAKPGAERSRPPVNIQPIASSATNGGSEERSGQSGKRKEMPPAGSISAPSIGPNTKIDYVPPEERLADHEISNVDAMGLDKRRSVVGGSYSPSLARQATLYGIFLAVAAALVIGFLVLANQLDQPPDSYPDEAPWSQADAPQRSPEPLQ